MRLIDLDQDARKDQLTENPHMTYHQYSISSRYGHVIPSIIDEFQLEKIRPKSNVMIESNE